MQKRYRTEVDIFVTLLKKKFSDGQKLHLKKLKIFIFSLFWIESGMRK